MDFFDATKVQPQQGVGGHPPGRFPFTITNTYLKPNSAGTGAMLVVEFTSDAGRIENRYNIINPSAQAVDIAQKELSALCHAVNIYRITNPRDAQGNYDMQNAARELRGGRGIMEVVPQTNKDGTPNGYMEVKKVFDSQGNEPGKQGSAPQPQQAQPQQQQPAGNPPMTAQPNGGWSQGTNNAPAPQNNSGPAWGNNQPQQQAPNNGGWQGNAGGQPQQGNAGAPPWGNK